MKTLVRIACVALLCCPLVSCTSTSYEPDRDGRGARVVYFNSFESAVDARGWTGVTEEMFVSDPAPGAGDQSLHIEGGCVQPTAHIVLPPQADDANYSLSCWGKLNDRVQPGKIVLVTRAGDDHRRAAVVTVRGDAWTLCKSRRTLYCPAGQELRIEIMIGGFVPASMLIDCVKVERIR